VVRERFADQEKYVLWEDRMLLSRREAMAGSGGLALLTGRPPFAIFYGGGRVAAGPACGLARRR
jgi:hypothetical protein